MKRTAAALLLFCLLPGLVLYGCSQPAATTPDATPAPTLSKAPVDFSLSDSDLTCMNQGGSRNYVKAGRKVILTARVTKHTDGTAAGGKVRFLLDGKQVDCVPFYMEKPAGKTTVSANHSLPLDKYAGLDEDGQTPLVFEARVEPDALHEDANGGNDSAQKQTAVRGDEPAQSAVYADAEITAFEASSDAGEGVAKPGTSLKLKIKYKGGGSGRTRARYYIDGSLVAEKPYAVSSSESSRTEYFYVPWDRTDELDCRVVLSGGESARLKVPVERFQYSLHDQDVSWNSSRIIPGQSVGIRCRVHADSNITFGYTSQTLRVVFVVNGEPSDPVKVDPPSGTVPYMGDVRYVYRVPKDHDGPLDVKVYVDAPNLFDEPDEGNNLASATIPVTSEGSDTPGLSVDESALWFSPAAIVPGQKVQLMAAIHNDAANKSAYCHRTFAVNGEVLDPNNTQMQPILGGQYYVTYEMWTVPDGLTSDPQFTVTIDPDHKLTGDDASDNSATLTLPLARPDLTAGDAAATPTGTHHIFSGGKARLTAVVYNKGPVPVQGVKADFIIDGAVVGSSTVDLSAYGAAKVSLDYDVPQMTDDTQQDAQITGMSGYGSPAAGKGTLNFSVRVDPDSQVSESDENNNTAGPVPLSVLIPSKKGRVYVTVRDSDSNDVEGAAVSISAGGKSCSATTDAHGRCSFFNVPFGPYEAVAEKAGYNQGKTYDETLYEGNLEDYAHISLDNKARVTGRVTAPGGGGLSGVSVRAKGKDHQTTTDASGNYTLKLPAGPYTIQYRKAGYERKDEHVTLDAASSLTKNDARDEPGLRLWLRVRPGRQAAFGDEGRRRAARQIGNRFHHHRGRRELQPGRPDRRPFDGRGHSGERAGPLRDPGRVPGTRAGRTVRHHVRAVVRDVRRIALQRGGEGLALGRVRVDARNLLQPGLRSRSHLRDVRAGHVHHGRRRRHHLPRTEHRAGLLDLQQRFEQLEPDRRLRGRGDRRNGAGGGLVYPADRHTDRDDHAQQEPYEGVDQEDRGHVRRGRGRRRVPGRGGRPRVRPQP